MRIPVTIVAFLALTGCTNSIAVQKEAEIFSSLPYDKIACTDLVQQRNALAARHGLDRNVKREPQQETGSTGFGIIIPDMRDTATRERARAIGEITAMNHSITRRQCGTA